MQHGCCEIMTNKMYGRRKNTARFLMAKQILTQHRSFTYAHTIFSKITRSIVGTQTQQRRKKKNLWFYRLFSLHGSQRVLPTPSGVCVEIISNSCGNSNTLHRVPPMTYGSFNILTQWCCEMTAMHTHRSRMYLHTDTLKLYTVLNDMDTKETSLQTVPIRG